MPRTDRFESRLIARGKRTFSVGDAPTPFPSEDLDNDLYQEAQITVEGAAVRVWLDGSNPTGAEGHKIGDGGAFDFDAPEDIARAKFIVADGEASPTATIQVTYYG